MWPTTNYTTVSTFFAFIFFLITGILFPFVRKISVRSASVLRVDHTTRTAVENLHLFQVGCHSQAFEEAHKIPQA